MGKIDIESELRAFWANLLDGDVRSIVICVVVFLVVFAGGIVIFSSSGSEQTSQSREQDLERLEYHKRLVDGSEQTSQSREQDLERLEYHKRLVDAIASINLEDVIPTDTTTYPHAPLTFFLPKYKSYGVTIWDLTKEFLFELRQCGAEVTDANECVSTDSVGDQSEDIILGFKLEEDAIKFDHFRVVFAIRQKNAPSSATPRFSKFSSWFHRDGDASESKLSTNSVSHPVIIKFKVSKYFALDDIQSNAPLVSALPNIPNGAKGFIKEIDESIRRFEDPLVPNIKSLLKIRDIFGTVILQFFVKTPNNFVKIPSGSNFSWAREDCTLEDMLTRRCPTAKVDVTTESFTYVIPAVSGDFVDGLSDATIEKSLQKALDAIVTLVDYYQVFGIVPDSFECQFGGNWYDVSIDASRKAKILGVS
eukprot:580262_1